MVSTMQIREQTDDHFAGPEIQVASRLVREQERGFSDKRARKRHSLLLAARQFPRAMRGAVS